MSTIKFNVAQLLRELVGARRDHVFSEDALPIDEQLVMRAINGEVRFTRTITGVFAQVKAKGTVRLICVRSLEEFDYPLALEFSDEFHSLIDVVSAVPLPKPEEEDPFFLTELHMADIGDAMREYALLALPINPVSPAYRDQPISYTVQSDGIVDPETDELVDSRFEALKEWAKQQNSRNSRS